MDISVLPADWGAVPFELEEILPPIPLGGGFRSQKEYDQAHKVVRIRRDLLDRLHAIPQQDANRQRALAEVQAIDYELQLPETTDRKPYHPHQVADLKARRQAALAKAAHCRALMDHFRLELRVYLAALGPGGE